MDQPNIYRLSQHITPLEYHLKITPIAPSYDIFKGKCIIIFNNNDPNLNYITLNILDLNISKVSLTSITNNIIINHNLTNTTRNKVTQQIKFEFDKLPKIGGLTIEYDGLIATNLCGFYKCNQEGKLIMVTQFEATHARRCFPCFDEPHFKSIFNLSIILPSDNNFTILSNTDVKTIITKNNNKIYEFKPTPKMSTYLLAFYIGYATYIESIINDIRVRIYSPKDKLQSKLALKTTVKCLAFMESYFNIPYPLEKLDLISVPKHSAEAMENWGLVTFREQVLLCNDSTKVDDIISIIVTICHELAHQWFGNLVTMEWWSELWLNESFATWLSYVAVNNIFPKLNINDYYFCNDYVRALKADAIINSHPIKADVQDPSLISEIFDAISYSKGSALIKMLVDYVGADDFKNSIQLYTKTYKYKNTTTNDLWDCISKTTNKNISKLMETWINTKNYPLITIKQYQNNLVQLTQQSLTNDKDNILWNIPLSNTFVLNSKHLIIPEIDNELFGFYITSYDEILLNKVIQNNAPLLKKANIILDLYFLLKSKHIDFNNYLKYTDAILHTSPKTYLLYNITLTNYSDFKIIIKNDKLIKLYNDILIKHITNVNFIINPNDDISTILFKTNILNLGCKLNINTHIDYCKQQFNNFKMDTNFVINPNIVNIVFRVGIEHLNDYNFLLNMLRANIKLESEIASCLGLTNDKTQYITTLDLFKNKDINEKNKLRIFATAASNKNLNYLLFPYIKENWNDIFNMFKFIGIDNIVSSMRYLVGTPILINDFKTFFADKDKHGMEMAYCNTLEMMESNYKFNNILNK
jgi:aminopeptidase N